MARAGDIYLGTLGVEQLLSAYGRSFRIADEEISRQGRSASGKLFKERITTKKRFELTYSEIDGDELETILDIYDLNSELSLLVYHTSDGESTTTTPAPGANYDSYTVLMDPIDRDRVLLTGTGLWSGVTVVLHEV